MFPSVVHVAHPLVAHHVTCLRHRDTKPAEFRALIARLAVLLAYEATQDLLLEACPTMTPIGAADGARLTQRIGLIPILRAGLGLVDPVLDLIPDAEVWHLGLYRDEETARPVEYYSKLPDGDPVDVAMILDPMLATGGSASAAIHTLRRWGVPEIKLLSVIAAEPGIRAVRQADADTKIYVCAIDPELNARKFIVPGLGDAGDRIFNTFQEK